MTNYNKAIIGSLLAAGSVTELFGFFAPETVFLQDYKNLLTFKEMEEPYPLGPKVEQAKKEVNHAHISLIIFVKYLLYITFSSVLFCHRGHRPIHFI